MILELTAWKDSKWSDSFFAARRQFRNALVNMGSNPNLTTADSEPSIAYAEEKSEALSKW